MNWLARIFASAVVRKLAFLFVALVLGWLGIGSASAQETFPDCTRTVSGAQCPDQTSAYAAARAVTVARAKNAGHDTSNGLVCLKSQAVTSVTFGWVHPSYASCAAGAGYGLYNTYRSWPVGAVCPAGTTWSALTETCFNSQRCFDMAPSSSGSISATANSACVDGCAFGPPPGEGATTLSFNGSAFVSLTKGWVATGGECASGSPPVSEQQQCLPLGSGQTACVKPDGQHCHTASTGRQICWKPGETGEKTDGPIKQVTNPGPTTIPPSTILPNGETLSPVGPTTTTTVSKPNGNGGNVNVVTTTNNYNTDNGTNADGGDGTGDDGEKGDGTGGEGEGEGDKGTVTGGGAGCEAPPAMTGGDPFVSELVREAYLQRCAQDQRAKDLIEGVTGLDGLFGTEDFLVDDLFVEDPATDGLDEAGFGFGRSCPPPPQFFGTVLDLEGLCSIMQMIGALVFAVGALHAVFILKGA